MKTDITQVMVQEHRLILRMIALVEANTQLLVQGRFDDYQFYLDAVDFIRNYADRFHHAKEEDTLFSALVANGMPEKSSPIEAMLIEHDQGRAFVKALEAGARLALDGASGQVEVIVESARGYAELLRGHIQKEDEILYPLAERILPETVRPAMVAAYQEATSAVDADFTGYYQRLVEKYESQLAA